MKTITNENYQETYLEETLDNGLHVVLWQKPDYEKSLCMMATPLGALDMLQIDEQGKEYSYPAGIAHFLEHKMFETEDGDVMKTFSDLGANVNAFTSYTETTYYFTTAADVIQPLHVLLDFVQELHISEKSIEKEKGIIIQELNMYKQMSDQRLLMEIFSSLYVHHPLKYDIGGDEESVSSITLEQLEECYAVNYHPGTMILICISSKDPQLLMDEIKQNQAAKKFPQKHEIRRLSIQEPYQPAKQQFTFEMDVTTPKTAVAFKMKGIEEIYERLKTEWCFRFLLDAVFSSLNPDYQTWLDNGIINDYVGSEIDMGKDYGMIMFYGESEKEQAFIDLVMQIAKQITDYVLSEDMLEQLKKRYYGQSLRSLNSFDDIAITMVRNYFDGSDFFRSMDILYDITREDIQQVTHMIDIENYSIIKLEPEKTVD